MAAPETPRPARRGRRRVRRALGGAAPPRRRSQSWQSTQETKALRLIASAVHFGPFREVFHWQ